MLEHCCRQLEVIPSKCDLSKQLDRIQKQLRGVSLQVNDELLLMLHKENKAFEEGACLSERALNLRFIREKKKNVAGGRPFDLLRDMDVKLRKMVGFQRELQGILTQLNNEPKDADRDRLVAQIRGRISENRSLSVRIKSIEEQRSCLKVLELQKEFVTAAVSGNVGLVEVLLDLGMPADLGVEGVNGNTILHEVAANGWVDVAILLLDRGAPVNSISQGEQRNTALHCAAIRGHAAMVQLLLTRGALMSSVSDKKYTAFGCAAIKGHAAVVQLLLDRGASVDLQKDMRIYEVFCIVAANGNAAVVQMLLDAGVSVDSKFEKDTYSHTALHYAAANGHAAVVQMLLKRGTSVDFGRESIGGSTALHYAAANGHADTVLELLAGGASVNLVETGPRQYTALHYAIVNGHRDTVRVLLDGGADKDLATYDGKNALDLAIEAGHDEVVTMIKEHKHAKTHLGEARQSTLCLQNEERCDRV